jgi:ATP-dependent DNA helicase RecG
MGLIEKYGSGIKRIINYLLEAGLPKPTFHNQSNGFLVTIYAKDIKNVVENVVEKRQEKLLGLLKSNNSISAKQIALQLKVTERTAQRDLQILSKMNLIKRVGSAKGGYWQIIEEGNTQL